MFGNTNTSFGSQPAGGGLFGNQANGNPFANNNTASNPSLFGNAQPNPNNNAGIFGAPQPQPQTGNIFGGANNNNATNNMFGGANQAQPFGNNNVNAGGGIFGGNNNNTAAKPMFGQPNNTNAFGNNANTGSVFGNNNAGGGIFGAATNNTTSAFGNNNSMNTPFKSNTANVFGNNNTSTPAFGTNNNNASIFGGTNNNNNAGGIFGANNNTSNTGGVFGGGANPFGNNNNNNNTGSIFGANNNNANNMNKGNVFGNTTNNNAGGGLFGNTASNNTGSIFGANNNTSNTGGGLFGANSNPANNNGGSIFGNNNNTNNGSVFGGTNNNTFAANSNTAGGVFGATNNNNNSVFGANNNTSTFAGGSLFGGNNNNQTNNANTGLGFSFAGNNNNNTSFGNTAWGVPTNNNSGLQTAAKFTPLKPKNTKIDGKHMVKSITLLDQNMNFCKNQLRIRFIMTGGQVPQQQQAGSLFGGAQTTAPAFGGQGSSVFGSNTNTASNNGGFSFGTGGNAFTNANTTTPSLGGGSLFGNTNNNSNTGSLFGANNTTSNGIGFNNTPQNIGTGSFFGASNNNSNIKGGSLFGGVGTPVGGTAASSSLFSANTNNNATNTNNSFSLGTGFGAPSQNGGSLFGNNVSAANSAGNTSLFGNNTQATGFGTGGGSLFGNNTAAQPVGFSNNLNQCSGGLFSQSTPQSGSLFGNQASAINTQPSLFGGMKPQGTEGFGMSPQPSSGFFGAITQGLFGATPQPAQQFGMNTSPQFNSAQNQADLTTALFNGFFNSQFFKKMVAMQNTPFDNLKSEAQKKPLVDFSNREYLDFSKKSSDSEQYFGYVPRYNKYNKAMYNSSFNFNHGTYLTPETTAEQFEIRRLNEDFKSRFTTRNQKLNMNQVHSSKFVKKNKQQQRDQILPRNFTSNIATSQLSRQTVAPASVSASASASNLFNNNPYTSISSTRRNSAMESDLPIIEQGYRITPSLAQLKKMTVEQLKHVRNVTIQNQYGKIIFKGELNLYKKNLKDCLSIEQNTIDIKDEEWDQIKCQLSFYNFGGYIDLDQVQKNKMERKIKKWVDRNNMGFKNFDRQTGQLHVQVY